MGYLFDWWYIHGGLHGHEGNTNFCLISGRSTSIKNVRGKNRVRYSLGARSSKSHPFWPLCTAKCSPFPTFLFLSFFPLFFWRGKELGERIPPGAATMSYAWFIRLVGHPGNRPFFPFVPCVSVCALSNAHAYTVFRRFFPFAWRNVTSARPSEYYTSSISLCPICWIFVNKQFCIH